MLFLVSGSRKRRALRQLLDGDDIPTAHVRARPVVIVADDNEAGRGLV